MIGWLIRKALGPRLKEEVRAQVDAQVKEKTEKFVEDLKKLKRDHEELFGAAKHIDSRFKTVDLQRSGLKGEIERLEKKIDQNETLRRQMRFDLDQCNRDIGKAREETEKQRLTFKEAYKLAEEEMVRVFDPAKMGLEDAKDDPDHLT